MLNFTTPTDHTGAHEWLVVFIRTGAVGLAAVIRAARLAAASIQLRVYAINSPTP